jgi:hypothetical protein
VFIRWTGLGFLLFVMSCAALPVAFYTKEAAYSLSGTHNIQLAELAVAVVMVPFAGVIWGVGSALNRRDDRHTVMDVPMQYGAGLFLFIAWLLPCVALGQVTHSWLGWVAFFCPPVIWFVVEFVRQWPAARAKAKAERDGNAPQDPPA